MALSVSKKEAEALMKIEGEVRGLGIKDDFLYIKNKLGQGSLKKVVREINELGYEFDPKSMNTLGFYPVGLEALGIVVMHRVLGLSKDEIRQMGAYEAKHSLIMRLFMKYFVSVDKLAEKAPEMWSKYYTEGEVSVPMIDEEKRKGLAILKDFKIHPLHCLVLEGYFGSVLEMVVKEKVNCKEVECPFKGGTSHKFSLSW